MKAVFCLACAALTACATPPPPSPSAPETSSMVAARDPQTGQLRPATAAELRALGASSLALHPAPGQVSLRADGRRQLHLGEAALVHLLARRDGDALTMQCVDDAHAAGAEAHHAGAEAHHAAH